VQINDDDDDDDDDDIQYYKTYDCYDKFCSNMNNILVTVVHLKHDHKFYL